MIKISLPFKSSWCQNSCLKFLNLKRTIFTDHYPIIPTNIDKNSIEFKVDIYLKFFI